MPAGSQNARRRAGRKPKPVGAAGTRAMPSPGGLTNARRKHSPRQNHYGHAPRQREIESD